MILWNDMIKKALDIHVNRGNYAYFYGAKGVVLTNKVMEELWQAHPEYNKKYENIKYQIFDYSRGKIGYDCSGFVGPLVGEPYLYSVGIFEHCTKQTKDLAKGVAGSILFKPEPGRHIGLDIGYGFGLHFPNYMNSCEMFRIRDTSFFTLSGEHKNVDYTGATNR